MIEFLVDKNMFRTKLQCLSAANDLLRALLPNLIVSFLFLFNHRSARFGGGLALAFMLLQGPRQCA